MVSTITNVVMSRISHGTVEFRDAPEHIQTDPSVHVSHSNDSPAVWCRSYKSALRLCSEEATLFTPTD